MKFELAVKIARFIFICIMAAFIGATMAKCQQAYAAAPEAPYRIAVIDTGMSFIPFDQTYFKLCPDGHYDFSKKKAQVGPDTIGHGSFVTALINAAAKTNNICFLIYKVFPSRDREVVTKALVKAYKAGAKAINMSLSIGMYSPKLERVVKGLAKRKIQMFVSSGNEGRNLNEHCMTYPQCFKNVGPALKLVGATNRFYEPEAYSNFGLKLHVWHWGEIGNMRGTSFASPRALGDYIKTLELDK